MSKHISPWVCNCGKLHDITPEIHKRMLNGEEIVTKCKDCMEARVEGLEETFDNLSDNKAYTHYVSPYNPESVGQKDLFVFEDEGTLIPMTCGHNADSSANNAPICLECCPKNVRFVLLAQDRHPCYVVDVSKSPDYPFLDTGMASQW